MSAVNHSECGGSAASAETTDDYHVKFDFCRRASEVVAVRGTAGKRHSGTAAGRFDR